MLLILISVHLIPSATQKATAFSSRAAEAAYIKNTLPLERYSVNSLKDGKAAGADYY
jgi:hypothetical protein